MMEIFFLENKILTLTFSCMIDQDDGNIFLENKILLCFPVGYRSKDDGEIFFLKIRFFNF